MAMKIPTTIVTGFLGAGKTSLIASLLRQRAQSLRMALLINEFGAVGMDASILAAKKDCADCSMIELANGCICCTVADDFVPAMESLAAMDAPPDHVVIETSGLALPQPLVRAFGWHTVRTRFFVQSVVTVLDCADLANGHSETLAAQGGIIQHDKAKGELLEEQLHHADIIVLNKADGVTAADMKNLKERIRPFHHEAVRLHEARHGELAAALLLESASAHHHHDDEAHDHHHHHDDHDHDAFSSVSLQCGVFPSQAAVEKCVTECMAAHHLYRLKGRVAIAGKARALVVQAVGGRVHCYYEDEAATSSVLVAIGDASLDGAALAHTLGHDCTPCTS